MNIVIMGMPGSGKSTQAEILAKSLGVLHLSTGDIFRKLKQDNTPLGARVETAMDRGHLVNNQDAVEIIDLHLSKLKDKGFVLDGAPRDLYQAEHSSTPIDLAIYIKLTDEECIKRLNERGRGDDTPEIIKERLLVYHQLTEPVLDFFRKQNKLLEVDGSPSVEEIARQISDKIKSYGNH